MKYILVTVNDVTAETAKQTLGDDLRVLSGNLINLLAIVTEIVTEQPEVLFISDKLLHGPADGMKMIRRVRKAGLNIPVVVFNDFTRGGEEMYIKQGAYPCSRNILHNGGAELEEAIKRAKELVSG